MMRFLLGILVLSSLSTYAQETPKAVLKETSEEKAAEAPAPKRRLSQINRDDKRFTVTAEIIGFSFNTTSTGLRVGYFLNPESVLSFSYVNMKNPNSSGDDEDPEDELFNHDGNGKAYFINYKRFIGSTFYVQPSLHYRRQDFVTSVSSSYDSITDEWTVIDKEAGKIEDIGLSLKIGNQWQWKNFTLGCDWIGISKSVATISKTGDISNSDLNGIFLVNFYLGASF